MFVAYTGDTFHIYSRMTQSFLSQVVFPSKVYNREATLPAVSCEALVIYELGGDPACTLILCTSKPSELGGNL